MAACLNSFSCLDIDQKTFGHLKLYYNAIIYKKPIIAIDNKLQAEELQGHFNRCNSDSMEIATSWITENAQRIRAYCNTLKIVAICIYFEKKYKEGEEITWSYFCSVASDWDELETIVVNTLKLR